MSEHDTKYLVVRRMARKAEWPYNDEGRFNLYVREQFDSESAAEQYVEEEYMDNYANRLSIIEVDEDHTFEASQERIND